MNHKDVKEAATVKEEIIASQATLFCLGLTQKRRKQRMRTKLNTMEQLVRAGISSLKRQIL